MIKGVSKQIVEINCTRNDYVERAFLVIRPEKSALPARYVSQKAAQYLQEVLREGLPPALPGVRAPEARPKRKRRRGVLLALVLLGGFLTSAVTALALLL